VWLFFSKFPVMKKSARKFDVCVYEENENLGVLSLSVRALFTTENKSSLNVLHKKISATFI
jgi:hypothetical protein